ncbi:MAG: phosphoadenosine phosphosulfate reductase family protein [Desulfobulbus sp.]|jgi:3'-phosphoadenosine 5'-phosphosulfate sulfotransferase (PAPS reductase)/FAD synthetase|nr:phosphoadenosine phosphosulfate reductase family protein [Desulfobulbus sp.]
MLLNDYLDFSSVSIDELVEQAKHSITQLFIKNHLVFVSWSSGKDSSTVLSLVLVAAAEYLANGHTFHHPIIVTHGDTGIENPEIHAYAMREIEKIERFCARNAIPIEIHTARPYLNSSWAVRVLSGRALPTFANKAHRDCSVSMKIEPQQRIRKIVLRKYAHLEPVILLGTRYDESTERNGRMTDRGERADLVWRSPDGTLSLSPICDWTTADVWEYLASCRDEIIERSYADFQDIFRLYGEASEGDCGAIEDMIGSGAKSSACGSRFGCMLCTAVSADWSLANMIEANPGEYGYLKPIQELQAFLVATQYDLNRRFFIGRSITDGYIAIGPDSYHPSMLEELFQICLTIDARERESAYTLGISPRFQLLDVQQIVAIDAIWSLQGYHVPFHGLYLYKKIVIDGYRYETPKIDPEPAIKFPRPRYLYVGNDWTDGLDNRYLGLQEATLDMTLVDQEFPTGCIGHKTIKAGTRVLDVLADNLFNVDPEAAALTLDLELDYLLSRHDLDHGSITQGYRHYLVAGVIQLAKSKVSVIDRIMKRTAWRERHGLVGPNHNIAEILARATLTRDNRQEIVQVPQNSKPHQLPLF